MAKKQDKSKSNRNAPVEAQRVGIFGASGSGKTTKARELVRKLGRVVFFDPLGEWGREKGVRLYTDLSPLKRALMTDFAKGFKMAFMPSFGNEGEDLDNLCKFLMTLQQGYINEKHKAQLTLVVDELDLSFPSGTTQRNPQHGFAYICRRGRHYGINLIGITQRTAQTDVVFRGNLSSMYFFRQAEVLDLEKAVSMLGREYKENMRKLNNFEYIFKSGEKIFVKK